MGAIGEEELMKWDKMQGAGSTREEKILVLVRLRPLSEKEIARNEVSDWECINETSILYRNSLQERSMFPTAYTYDRVFGGDCSTRQVYDAGAKEIALSVVSGINSSIFAYGQTSSGKTYTMLGITEYTVADIYDYIQRHEERAFVLKFSAMEIYNEVVRDLLSTDNIPLRLLDDPEKGTFVEKLTEETLRDQKHLKELLSVCEAQRQVGETSLNETIFMLWVELEAVDAFLELARLESELITPAPTSTSDHTALLKKKDLQIEKLERELKEACKQRDLNPSQAGGMELLAT